MVRAEISVPGLTSPRIPFMFSIKKLMYLTKQRRPIFMNTARRRSSFFLSAYFFFMAFIALAAYDSVDLVDVAILYQNETILSLVQISNLILLIWALFTGFYHLYKYFKKRCNE